MKVKAVFLILLFVITSVTAQDKNRSNVNENHAPVFVKEMPDTVIQDGKVFRFSYKAEDLDGDIIKYGSLKPLPTGAIINDSTGLFTWKPNGRQGGKHEIIITASDEKSVTNSRTTKLVVIVSWIYDTEIKLSVSPSIGGNVNNHIYLSNVGDTITAKAYSNPGYRFMSWTENDSIVSKDSVYTFVVIKNRNLVANFRINRAPVFVKEMPDTVFYEGRNFVFTYKAIDPDGDTVKYYSTSVFPSSAALIARTGVFGWRPNHFQSGTFQIMIYASDGSMITYSRTASVKIYADCCISGPPIIIRGLPEGAGTVSYSMAHDTITARAVSNKGFKFLNWTEYGTVVSTDSVYTYVVTEMRNLAAHFTSTSSLYDEMGLPKYYSLSQNYPNPFNPETTISFALPKSEHVTLKVYDLLGREVATLVNETKAPGNYSVKFNGSDLPSAIYFYQMTTQNNKITNKMTLVK